MRLTPAGALCRERVGSIPATLTAAADEGSQLSRGEACVLRLLHSSTVPVSSLMPDLDRFMRDCPGARIDLDRASSEDQVTKIADGHADIGVVRLPVLRRDARVRFVELAAERLCAAVPADHPLAGRKRVAIARFRREPFVPARMASVVIDGVVFVPISDEDARSVCALVLPVEPTVLAEAFVRVVTAG
ncbi:LysR substrate-binding domain-containing protein [Burkholderia metallica]|uniref:LysR substrate-binding domain-containing protein n=1 Tax=Burkholderia metallica TaxID=488729 RepID=UPI003F68A027